MTHTSSLVFAGIAPHPPIMVPEVGRDAIVEVRTSIDAMAELTHRVLESKAETVVLISPHAPLEASAFVAYDGPQIYGDFSMFRAPATTVEAELDEELLREIERTAAADNLITSRIQGFDLDHGTAVPLYFLQRNGWEGRVIALGYTFLSNEDHVRFGKCITKAIEKSDRRVAFIASGDLSHRLKRDAPAGYNPDAHLFDEEIVDAIRSCSTIRIVDMDPDLRRMAGECGYRSMLVAIGVADGAAPTCEVINYEAPFGVGYMVAQLVLQPNGGKHELSSDEVDNADHSIPGFARQVIETFIASGIVINPPDDLPDLLKARAGCFVSIKTLDSDLRGCIGTIDPAKDTLAEEIIANAINAATRDPRFSPVRTDELPDLKYSVDVLSAPEPTTVDGLDPGAYGVIVEDETGSRRGLLLPNLAGVDTAVQQIDIAARKAGIDPRAKIKLFRFHTKRYSE